MNKKLNDISNNLRKKTEDNLRFAIHFQLKDEFNFVDYVSLDEIILRDFEVEVIQLSSFLF